MRRYIGGERGLKLLLLIGLVLGTMISCTSDDEGNIENRSKKPMIYREYIEEGGEEYLEEEREKDEGKIYYRDYKEKK
ncbi:hypothetical protein [Propionigenium maris]|uniref:hypothetical protein n=1 Tax=Propionigenium maris TaxID=45622 RepID=UPI00249250DA|nr:hypothetical protein [Propionigenium maris]